MARTGAFLTRVKNWAIRWWYVFQVLTVLDAIDNISNFSRHSQLHLCWNASVPTFPHLALLTLLVRTARHLLRPRRRVHADDPTPHHHLKMTWIPENGTHGTRTGSSSSGDDFCAKGLSIRLADYNYDNVFMHCMGHGRKVIRVVAALYSLIMVGAHILHVS